MHTHKLIIIGLDGATWKVINPLVKENNLENLKNITNRGSYGILSSCYPPVTGPAWLSMATGKNPGKIGIFDFISIDKDYSKSHIVNSNDFIKNHPYWDLLNNADYETIISHHPMLYPLYDLKGIMTAGIGSPNDSEIVKPKIHENKINNITQGYWARIDWHSSKYYNKNLFIEDLTTLIEKQFNSVDYLLNEKWDLFLHICSATDFLQHVMWKDWKKKDSTFYKEFVNIWKLIDENIGKIYDRHRDSNLFIVSDHGFGSLNYNFNLNKMLIDIDYLKRKRFFHLKKIIFDFYLKIFKIFKNTKVGKKIKIIIKDNNIGKKSLNIGLPVSPEIDIIKSKVLPGFSSGLHGTILIKDENEKREIKKEIKKEFLKIEKRYKISIDVFEQTDLYIGDKIDLAPDILFSINNFNTSVQYSKIEEELFSEFKAEKNKTGTHRTEGILIATGPDIKENFNIKASIYDIFPTILHMFNVSIPRDIDGKVLKEIFKEDSELSNKDIVYKKKFSEKELLKFKINNLKSSGKI